MARPTPVNRESPFTLDELFFSRTDKKGVILSGNDVFVRVSGYSRERMIGAPHNVIRHPDMPKAVFKLFWNTLEAGKSICAYVKNMAADGSFYWVAAAVFPTEDGYVSVRTKPTTPLFATVTSLYPKVLEKEKREGVDAALVFLLDLVKQAGFESYDQLMARMIVEELRARSEAVKGLGGQGQFSGVQGGTDGVSKLRAMGAKCLENAELNHRVFSRLDDFSKVNSALGEKSAFILKSFKHLDLLAINMSTAAKRLGVLGQTLVAVSSAITKSAGEFKGELNKFNASADKVGRSIEKAEFRIAASQLQVDMIEYYIRETLAKWANQAASGEEFEDMRANFRMLLALTDESARLIREELAELNQLLILISGDAEQLRATINSVEIIRKTGVIEAAQVTGEASIEFETYFRGMNALVAETGRQLGTFSDLVRRSIENIDYIRPSLLKTGVIIGELREDAEKLSIE